MMRRLPGLLVCCVSLACAKPSAEQGSSGSTGAQLERGEEGGADSQGSSGGSLDAVDSEGHDGEDEVSTNEDEITQLGALTPAEAPPANSCPASKLREVRYGSTVPQQVKLQKDIASLRCVKDLDTKIQPDLACAREFNEASWAHALYSQGLELVEFDQGQMWMDEMRYQSFELGEIIAPPDKPKRKMVYTGSEGSNCSGGSVLTQTSPGVRVARNRNNELVVVIPKPNIDSRSYARCSCFPGCGAYMEPMPQFGLIPKGRFGGTVELVYPAISIATHAVENQSCCCAP